MDCFMMLLFFLGETTKDEAIHDKKIEIFFLIMTCRSLSDVEFFNFKSQHCCRDRPQCHGSLWNYLEGDCRVRDE
jgi:hypothetical protein